MADLKITPEPGLTPRSQLALTARGLIAENIQTGGGTFAGFAPTSQTIYFGPPVGLRTGDVVANIVMMVTQTGTGTAPTGIYVALYSTASARLAVSANLASDAAWGTSGYRAAALS